MAKVEAETTVTSELTADEFRQLAQQQAMNEMNRVAEAAQADADRHAARGEILLHKVIDGHEGRLATITPIGWVPITPSMCTEKDCGYDAAVEVGKQLQNAGIGCNWLGWDNVPEDMMYTKDQSMRDFMVQILERHKSIRHAAGSQKHIRTAEQAAAARTTRTLPEGFVVNPRV